MNITLAPNVNSAKPTQPIPACVDQYQLYAHRLSQWKPQDLPLSVEAGAVKEGDRCDGKACRDEIPRLALAGATMISMDEPIVAGIRDPEWKHFSPWPHGHCVDYSDRHQIYNRVTLYCDTARSYGLKVNWIEAVPHVRPSTWLEALDLALADGVKISRVTVDWNPYAGATVEESGIPALRVWCDTHGVELACIVMGFADRPIYREQDYIGYSWKHWQQLYRACKWDRVVVQSWLQEDDKRMPSTDTLISLAHRIAWFDERGRTP